MLSSGQVSPSDTLDSGTCSDLDGTPPPLPKKKGGVSVTVISALDSDDNESSISYDSLNECQQATVSTKPLPQGLLRDIRNVKLSDMKSPVVVDESTYEQRKERERQCVATTPFAYEADCYYDFHLNENKVEEEKVSEKIVEDETFAGYKDFLSDGSSTIRSAKGTVRGVKNRVRAGIATFLQINSVTKVRCFVYVIVRTRTCAKSLSYLVEGSRKRERK